MTVQLFLRKPVAPRSCSVSSWSFAMCVGVVLDLVVWLRHFTNEITVSGLVGSNVVQGPIPEPASCCLRHTLSNLKKHISWVQEHLGGVRHPLHKGLLEALNTAGPESTTFLGLMLTLVYFP